MFSSLYVAKLAMSTRRYNRYERQTERTLQAKGISSSLAKADRTTKVELYRIWDELTDGKMGKLLVEWDYKYNKKTMYDRPVIMNLGNPLQMGGTHWVAIWRNKYSDSYGLPPSEIVIKNGFKGSYNKVQIQGIINGNCGQYALLWLYYIMSGREAEFYSLFT